MSESTHSPSADKAVDNTPLSDEDVVDFLGEGDKDTLDLTTPLKGDKDKDKDDKDDKDKDEDIKVEEDDEDKKDEEEDEEIDEDEIDEDLKALEEELEDPTDEKLELVSPVPRREILKKYPEIFKDFPYLEKAYYREQQFTNIYPTIDDAKAAAESAQVLERYTEDMIEKGNTHNVLKMIKDNNPETFRNVVDNYLEHLAQVDESAHLHVIGNVIKTVIIDMVRESRDSNDADLKTAAMLLNKHVFHSTKFTPPAKLAKGDDKTKDDTKSNELSEREQQFLENQIKSTISEVNSSVNSVIGAAINKHIDPKGSMSDYVKKNAARDAMEKVTALIDKDVRFKKIVDKLYEKAAAANFSKESQESIKKAYYSKAKSLLAPVLKSARNEALKGSRAKSKDEDIDKDIDKTDKDKTRQRTSERRLSSDSSRAKLDKLGDMNSVDALNALMGD